MGFEGLRSPIGEEIDLPMWGTVLILVPYPTNLVSNVQPNFASVKRYTAANIGPQQGGGERKLIGQTVSGLAKLHGSCFI